MNTNVVERTLIAASALFTLTALARWHRSEPMALSAPARHGPAGLAPDVISDSALAEAVGLTVTNDPFRLSNTPPDARFDPAGDVAPGVRAFVPPPVRPSFVLKAIVGGPPWQAVVDGIPGQPSGTIARQGTQYDKLVVRSVTRDSVIIQGPDTSWVLRFGRHP